MPRLFELASLASLGLGNRNRHIGIVIDIENVARRVTARISVEDVDVAAWPLRERLAIQDFSMAWWHALLSILPGDNPIEGYFQGTEDSTAYEVLSAIAQYIEDMSPYLEIWQDAMERGSAFPAASHLLVFVAECINAASWSGSAITDVGWGQRNLQWEQVSQQWQQVSRWVRDPDTARAFYHALEALEIPNFAGARDAATYALILSEDMPDFLLPALSWLADRAAAT